MPRQAAPITRAPYAGAMFDGGVEADNWFTDIVDFVEHHPYLLAPLLLML